VASTRDNASGMVNPTRDVPAVLLVGGKGTRLQSVVSSAPKPLARVRGVPFLQLLLLQLRSQGIRQLVMCTGHLADQIEDQFGDGGNFDLKIEYSRERQPLGTAGALKFAECYLKKVPIFFVMNGDSFLELDFAAFLQFHRQHGGLVSMAVCQVSDSSRYGTVQMNDDRRVVGFYENTQQKVPGVINAGTYIVDRAVLNDIPSGASSLEKDIFPHLLDRGVYGFEQTGVFIDIGTPEDYARADALYDTLYQAAIERR
jgi:NDP-sugar pyrophosphorylase family protein